MHVRIYIYIYIYIYVLHMYGRINTQISTEEEMKKDKPCRKWPSKETRGLGLLGKLSQHIGKFRLSERS